MSHDRGCPCGLEKGWYHECTRDDCFKRGEVKPKQDDFDYVLDQVKSLSKPDQKDIAEDILKRFNEDGWDINWFPPTLEVQKTEYL